MVRANKTGEETAERNYGPAYDAVGIGARGSFIDSFAGPVHVFVV